MKGTLETHRIESKALATNPLGDPSTRRLLIYLPVGHNQSRGALPAVYFLHGFSGSVDNWTNSSAFQLTVPERIDALIESGKVPPFVGVFIDGWTAFGGSQWINSAAVGNYRDYVVQDVVPFVEHHTRAAKTANARAIVGKSSGGYGALVMARHHPDVFAHVACHSGDSAFEYCYLHDFPKAAAGFLAAGGVEAWFKDFVTRARETKMRGDDFSVINVLGMAAAYSPKKGVALNVELPFDSETARLRADVWAKWLEHDPVRFIPKSIDAFKKLQSLFIDCGTRDEFSLRWGTRMVVEELKKAKIDHTHEEFEDGHMGINYRYDRSLSLLVPRMKIV